MSDDAGGGAESDDEPGDEEVVRTAAEAAEGVVFAQYDQSAVTDLDVTVTFENGVLDVDVYLNAPTTPTRRGRPQGGGDRRRGGRRTVRGVVDRRRCRADTDALSAARFRSVEQLRLCQFFRRRAVKTPNIRSRYVLVLSMQRDGAHRPNTCEECGFVEGTGS